METSQAASSGPQLAGMVPRLVDQLTPDGTVPDDSGLQQILKSFAGIQQSLPAVCIRVRPAGTCRA